MAKRLRPEVYYKCSKLDTFWEQKNYWAPPFKIKDGQSRAPYPDETNILWQWHLIEESYSPKDKQRKYNPTTALMMLIFVKMMDPHRSRDICKALRAHRAHFRLIEPSDVDEIFAFFLKNKNTDPISIRMTDPNNRSKTVTREVPNELTRLTRAVNILKSIIRGEPTNVPEDWQDEDDESIDCSGVGAQIYEELFYKYLTFYNHGYIVPGENDMLGYRPWHATSALKNTERHRLNLLPPDTFLTRYEKIEDGMPPSPKLSQFDPRPMKPTEPTPTPHQASH